MMDVRLRRKIVVLKNLTLIMSHLLLPPLPPTPTIGTVILPAGVTAENINRMLVNLKGKRCKYILISCYIFPIFF